MDIILLSDIRTLGKRGDVVSVKPGYARNYLLPQNLGLEANRANLAYFQQQRKKIDARHTREREAALEVAETLSNLSINITKRVGESGTLYGSVTAINIAEALQEQGVTIDRRRLKLDNPIKSVGEHLIPVDLHAEVIAELKVTVVPATE
ncbi:MAG: 50S ribosomal protein L9 [Acidobacteriota bacterium]